MTNYASGHLAEKHAVTFLENNGYRIVKTNWKTRYCEIDIIANRQKRIHFFEVKYRRNTNQGTGLEYITDRKLRQMKFAAAMWVQENNWQYDYALGALELSGSDYLVTSFLSVLD